MLMTDVIAVKRDGGALSPDTIRKVISDYTLGAVPDYQMAALLMAVYINGLDQDELTAWAGAMLRSGEVLDLSHVPGPKVDKHSTGGVGDKISLALAPAVAACGVRVPMISGRGLGHTGGTLDKLESIPGFRTDLAKERFVRCLEEVGACIIGQTDDLAPADKKIYALRDSTATVASIPLISASIMSKKLAEGIGGLVLDVKVGTGAFMKDLGRARELAGTLVAIGRGHGVKTTAVITDMNQPIGRMVGNALEVREAVDVMHGRGPADTRALVEVLGGAMLWIGGRAPGPKEGAAAIGEVLDDGRALDVFCRMVEFQGGDPTIVEDPGKLPAAMDKATITASKGGWVCGVDTERVGLAAVVLGAGRRRKEDPVDHAVGFEVHARLGHEIGPGEPLVTVHFDDRSRMGEVRSLLESAWHIGEVPFDPGPLVIEWYSDEPRRRT